MSQVIQRGQMYPGEMAQAYAYTYQPFLTSNPQPAAHPPNYGRYAAQNARLLTGLGNVPPTPYPGTAILPRMFKGLGAAPAIAPAPPPAVSWHRLCGQTYFRQGPPVRIPSARRVMEDAFQQPNSRAPMLYGRSLGQALSDVYRW